jgi:hypothetical protein
VTLLTLKSFRPGVVDMEQSVVNANAITLPETFGDFELLLPGDIATEYVISVYL